MPNEMSAFFDHMEKCLDWDNDEHIDNRSSDALDCSDVTIEDVPEDEHKEYDSAFWTNINNKGFLVYQNAGRFCLQKFATPADNRLFDAEEYNDMDSIAERINDYLLVVRKKKYEVTASYNHGFGPEFDKITIEAQDEAEAQILAIDVFRTEKEIKDPEMEIMLKLLAEI